MSYKNFKLRKESDNCLTLFLIKTFTFDNGKGYNCCCKNRYNIL